MRVIGYVIAALLAAVCAANAATDELSALYTQVLQRPADSETNLRYARAAEAAGKLRWAYAAYERVAVNDPSNREAQGLSILEAMALGRPVVASTVGGIPEMIEHGRTGLLVPPRDPDQLAGAIVRLLTDHPYADTLGRAGRALVEERFCADLMVRAIETIYDEAVADEQRVAAG